MIPLLLKTRYLLFSAVLALLGGLILLDRHVAYEQSLESFFPSDDPAVIAYKATSQRFGNDNIVFVSYDDPDLLTDAGLARVEELADALGHDKIEPVVDVQSLARTPAFWQIDDGLLTLMKAPSFARPGLIRAAREVVKKGDSTPTIARVMRSTTSESERAKLREKIGKHPLLEGTVVNREGTSTALVVRLKAMGEQDPKTTVAALRKASDEFALRHKLGTPALVGPPVLLADGFSAIERDGRRLAMAGMLLIGLVTLSATRSLWWAIVPILAGWTVWLAAETVLASFGLKLSLSGGPLVAQIIVLTMPAASHLAIHFRDDSRKERDRRVAAVSTLRAVTAPILWCAATGAIGYGALLTSNVMPVFQFGAILALCTVLAAMLTFAISPIAMLPPVRLEIPVEFGTESRVGMALNRLTAAVVRHPALIVVGVFVVVLPLISGIPRLRYESNYINAFSPEARVVQDYHSTERRLGGIGLVSLVVPAPKTLTPETIASFAGLDQRLGKLRRGERPAIARTISLATLLDPDGRLLALGSKAGEALKTKLELIDASPQGSLLQSFWDRSGGMARVLVRASEQQEASDKKATFSEVEDAARAIPTFGASSYVNGLSYLLNRTTEGVIATQWTTIGWSVGSILVMLTLAFRSPWLAMLALLPTLLAVALVLGLMGWVGIKLDVATALVGSVALGLSVDDTFHCLLQYRRMRRTESFRDSLFSSYAVTGPGVLLSSLAVAVGFVVLRFSEFAPFSNFGTMVGIATLGSSLGNLVLLPACLALGDRWRRVPAPITEPEATAA